MSGKILIVDDVATNRIVLKVKLAKAQYEVVQAAGAREALQAVSLHAPDLVMLDIALPDRSGLEVIRELRADPATAHLPVIALGAPADAGARIAALRAGANDFLLKPLEDLVLLARLRSLMRSRDTAEELRLRETTAREMGFAEGPTPFERPARICLVAPRPEVAMGWRKAITARMTGAEIALHGRDQALGDAGPGAFDAYVIAADLDRPGEGLRLLSELRSRPATRYAAICIAVGAEDSETVAMALDLGASDVVPLDVVAQPAAEEAVIRLCAQIARKRQRDRSRALIDRGLRLAAVDPLTGLYNRRYAIPHLQRIADRARQTGRGFAVMVIDIDRFKSVNDIHGHAAGDRVLVEVSERLRHNLREVDLIARIGGEEFLVVMPETEVEAARTVAERICIVVSETPIEIGGPMPISVTVSIGLSMGRGDEESPAVMAHADRALLGSKANGRNQVRIAPHSSAA